MKRRFYCLCVVLFFSTQTLSSQVVFFQEDFETDGTGTRYTAPNQFADVGQSNPNHVNDYWGRILGNQMDGAMLRGVYVNPGGPEHFITNNGNPGGNSSNPVNQIGNYTGFSGEYFFAGEDIDDTGGSIGTPGGGAIKSVTFNPIDISGHDNVVFKGLFAAGNTNLPGANRYDAADRMRIHYSVDGGSEVEGLCFHAQLNISGPGDTSNEPLAHDPECDGDSNNLVPGVLLTNSFQEFTIMIPEGNTLNLRVEVGSNSGEEEMAFDNLRLEGMVSLPVEFAEFDATSKDDGTIHLLWKTVSEINNAGFEIQHASVDAIGGLEWISSGFVQGQGDSEIEREYSYVIPQLVAGIYKLRIKQIDFDGSASFSQEIEARIDLPNTHALGDAYPNPFNPTTTFTLLVQSEQWVDVNIYDALGNLVKNIFSGQVPALQTQQFEVEANGLASGVYLYRVVGSNFAESKRMLLMK